MKFHVFAALLCIAFPDAALAQNDVYLCTDDNGGKEYRNTGVTKGCKKLELPGMTTMATPQQSRPTTARAGGAKGHATSNVAAANFPKTDDAAQKSRDSERKLILQDELKAEQRKLTNLKADFNNGEPERHGDERNYARYQERVAGMQGDIARSERNVEALMRELSNMR